MPMTPSEKQAAYRERQRLAEKDKGQPWEGLIGEEREQAIRKHFGYGASETRTQAEREAVAERMLRNAAPQIRDEAAERERVIAAAKSFVPQPGPRQDRAVAYALWYHETQAERIAPYPAALPPGLKGLPVMPERADFRKRDLKAILGERS